ncbi:MAG: SNF2-related protein, partial [Bacteroidota bacterium]
PFQVVYSLYQHEYLGTLLSAHVLEVMPSGDLSLGHQGLYPDNIEQFAAGVDETDKALVKLLASIIPKYIIKKYGKGSRNVLEFFTKKYTGELKKMVEKHVQRQMAKALPLLRDRKLFIMGKDEYPAFKRVEVLDEKASILFHVYRNEDGTVYFPTIKLGNDPIRLEKQRDEDGLLMPCLEPAWMLVDNQLFTFKIDIEGKKLLPFVKKAKANPFRRAKIEVPQNREAEYYQKFVSQLVERYKIHSKGFEIEEVKAKPEFVLAVKEKDNDYVSFEPEVVYDRFRFPINGGSRYKAILENQQTPEPFKFFKIKRDEGAEAEIRSLIAGLKPTPQQMDGWFLRREEGLAWLASNGTTLEKGGIQVEQTGELPQINLEEPEVVLETSEEGDWFDIRAVVKIGAFEIPFIRFRNHILRQKREYKLPDGSIVILPETWFSDYRHLLEVSETNPGEEQLRIRKYQLPLLNFPSKQKNQLTELVRNLKNGEGIPKLAPPEHFNAQLRNYQQEGYEWLCYMKDKGMGGILADEMGLGKTIQTLALLQREKELGTASASLVVLPTSLIHNWFNEAQKFCPQLKTFVYTGVSRLKNVEQFEGVDVVLSTYGIVRQDADLLRSYPFHYLILDESQTIKNPASKTARAIKSLVSRHRLSLTGTPIENTVMDMWSQMSFLNPGLLGNEAFFKKFYVLPIEKAKDPVKTAKLRRVVYPFILRRKKQKVEKDLPPRIEKLHYCGMTESQETHYSEVKNMYRDYLLELVSQGTYKRNKLNLLTGLQKLRQIAIHPKLVEPEKFTLEQSGKYLEVKRLLRQVIQRRSKVLIFSQFVKMLQLLKNDLEEEGIRFNYLDGATRDRQHQVDTFQENPDIRVFLISLKAGGVGLNLTAADYVFILDPWWNPAVENQAIDRSHRIGQKKTVFYYKFITDDTIEEKILHLQQRKAKLSDDIIQLEEDMYKSMSEQDLEELLR